VEPEGRLDRIEAALLRLSSATEAGIAGATQMTVLIRQMVGVVDQKVGMVEQKVGMVDQKVGMVDMKIDELGDRVTGFDRLFAEIIGRLHIIGEQLATHSHGDDGH
jgi:hypothetical protein